MKSAQIKHIARFIPEQIVRNEPTPDAPDFFKAPKERHFAWPKYNAADLGVLAVKNLLHETGLDPNSIDIIICSTSIQDYVNISVGPDIQYRSGASRARVLSIDTGCASYISMLTTADALIKAGVAKTIVLVTVTNFISRLTDFQKSPKSKVLGDGASATLVIAGENSILASVEESHGEHYGLFMCRPRSANGEAQNYWETGTGPLQVEFNETNIQRIRNNSIDLVVGAMKKCLSKASLRIEDIDYVVTHQPNRALLRAWREGISATKEQDFDTFDQYGNLFQTTIPVTISELSNAGKLDTPKRILLGTFSNGGDFVAGMLLKVF